MRIGFIGKGGSGKTSISAAFAMFLASSHEVLFVDADVNAHAHECFGIPPSKPLGERKKEVAEYLIGTRTDIEATQMIGTTPPNKDSQIITNLFSDPLIHSLRVSKGPISLITVGTYTEEDSGVNCYHSKLMPLEMLLHHTLDKKDECIVVDSTAGIDIIGTSLYMAFDVLFFIIEPSKKSISVLKTFMSKTTVTVVPILNKVSTSEDIAFVKHEGITPLVCFEYSESLRLFEQGRTDAFQLFMAENTTNFSALYSEVEKATRDYVAYYQTLASIYKKSCETWYNAYFETNIFKKTASDISFIHTTGKNNE